MRIVQDSVIRGVEVAGEMSAVKFGNTPVREAKEEFALNQGVQPWVNCLSSQGRHLRVMICVPSLVKSTIGWSRMVGGNFSSIVRRKRF